MNYRAIKVEEFLMQSYRDLKLLEDSTRKRVSLVGNLVVSILQLPVVVILLET